MHLSQFFLSQTWNLLLLLSWCKQFCQSSVRTQSQTWIAHIDHHGCINQLLCLVNGKFLKTKHWVFTTLFEMPFFTNVQTLKLGFQSNYRHWQGLWQAFLLGVLSVMLELTVGSTWFCGCAQRACADRLGTKTNTTAKPSLQDLGQLDWGAVARNDVTRDRRGKKIEKSACLQSIVLAMFSCQFCSPDERSLWLAKLQQVIAREVEKNFKKWHPSIWRQNLLEIPSKMPLKSHRSISPMCRNSRKVNGSV